MSDTPAQLAAELEQEFADCFGLQQWPVPEAFQALVVLSEGPAAEFPPGDERRERTPELASRTRQACRLFLEQKHNHALIVLDGYDAQLEQMHKIVRGTPIPLHSIYLLNCGQAGQANTKSQMEALRASPLASSLRRIVIVTSTYHVPRVARTAAAQLPPTLQWAVVGVPGDTTLYDPAVKTEAEIERIIKYSGSGDIAARLPHKLWRNFVD